jgi:FkbM family methyltransferase
MNLKRVLKKIAPEWALKLYRRYNARFLIEEILHLNIESSAVSDDGMPWVKLAGGSVFYGLRPSEFEQEIYDSYRLSSYGINKDCFGVMVEIVERYMAPRSMPGELILSPSKYAPIRDPLNDLELTENEVLNVANEFKVNPGEVVVDVGAFHGYGTMRLAEKVGPEGFVIAFEVDSESLGILHKNIKANKLSNVKVLNIALSDHSEEEGHFYCDKLPTGNSLRGDVLVDLGLKNLNTTTIKIDTGDHVLSELGILEINHLNITVNGGEPEALQGLKGTLARSHNVRVTLPGWYYRDGARLDKLVCSILREFGFQNVLSGRLGRVVAWK